MRDNGIKSRKLWYAVGTSVGVIVTGILGAILPTFRPMVEPVIGGLVGALATYIAGNVGVTHVLTKNSLQNLQTSDNPPNE